jgi:hypothetical protein
MRALALLGPATLTSFATAPLLRDPPLPNVMELRLRITYSTSAALRKKVTIRTACVSYTGNRRMGMLERVSDKGERLLTSRQRQKWVCSNA